MANESYNNLINEVEVSLAIERLLIADTAQAWTPARVDLTAGSLPTGFRDLGAVVDDTPSFSFSREKFQINTGIPRITQYEAVIGLTAEFAVSLHSNSWRKIQYAFGNYSNVASPTVVTTIQSVTDRYTVTLATSTTSLPVGTQVIISATTPGLDFADATETRVNSIDADTLTYYFDPLTTPINTPTAGDFIAIYGLGYVVSYAGTSKITKYQLLGVADFIDGVQVVHHIPKVVPGGDYTEELRPDANGRIPLTFNAFGVQETIRGNAELITAKRYYFPASA